MSTHLPEDVARWPSSPFEVLGVQPGVAPRDLRKAYTNLIRVYKPEHHPEQFRRIREAFESIQRFAAFHQSEPEATSPEPTPVPDFRVDDVPPKPGASHLDDVPTESKPALPLPPTVEELWGQASAGEQFQAYRGLVQWLERLPRRTDIYAQLYWLAVLFPEVDPSLHPAEWLARGLRETNASRDLLTLYASELRYDPSEAGSPRYDRLLAGANSQAQLIALFRIRWEALARIERWGTILGDLLDIHTNARIEEEGSWLPLLVDLYRWIGGREVDKAANDLRDWLRQDLHSLDHLGLKFGYYFDQLEWLDAVAASCRWVYKLPDRNRLADGFLRTLSAGSALPIEQIRGSFETLLRTISAAPIQWVEWFDTFDQEGYAALTHFANLLTSYGNEMGLEVELPYAANQLRDMVNGAVNACRNYDSFRSRMLKLCLDEAVTPELVGQAFSSAFGWTSHVPRDVQRLAQDLPLQLVCRAVNLFRA